MKVLYVLCTQIAIPRTFNEAYVDVLIDFLSLVYSEGNILYGLLIKFLETLIQFIHLK